MKHTLLFTAFMFLFFQCALAQNYILDNTFGTAGELNNPLITSGQVIQLQSDGKIVSCYLSSYSTSGNVHLVRFNVDGSIDTTFGTNGFVNSILFSETGGINMLKIQSDDKIIVTGDRTTSTGSSAGNIHFSTARYNINGTLDTAFGVNGYAIADFGAINGDTSKAIEIQNDGKILVGGSVYSSDSDLAIVRYLSNGLLDTSFATNGKFTYNFGTTTIPYSNGLSSDDVIGIKINSMGKIIVGATTNVNGSIDRNIEFGFICLNYNGALDTSFGNNGQNVINFGGTAYLDNLKITADDKIIATGEHDYTVGTNQLSNIPLVKLLANGNLDTSFGNDGIVLTNRDTTNSFDIVHDLSIQPDGKIICFGQTPNSTLTAADFLLINSSC